MKSIKISNRTYKKIKELQTEGDTLDSIIQRLIAVRESLALMVTIGKTADSQKNKAEGHVYRWKEVHEGEHVSGGKSKPE